MDRKELKDLFTAHPHATRIAALAGERGQYRLSGLRGSAPAFVVASAFEAMAAPAVVLLPDREEAAYFHNDLVNLIGNRVWLFPPSFRKPWTIDQPDNNNILQRAETLSAVSAARTPQLVVTSAEAIFEKVITRRGLARNTREVRAGETIPMEDLLAFFDESGFERTDFVFEPGQYAVRGGIVDIFSYASELPYRIELAGDTVGSIRSFEPLTQLSQKPMQFVTVIPNIRNRVAEEESTPLFSFIPEETVWWLGDPATTVALLDEHAAKGTGDGDRIINGQALVLGLGAFPCIEFGERTALVPRETFAFRQQPQPSFNKNFDLLLADLHTHAGQGMRNIILSDTARQVERIYSIFEDLGKRNPVGGGPSTADGLFSSILLSIHEGFIDEDLRLACYTDHQIFNRYHRYRLRQHFSRNEALTLKELYALKPGDYITHIDHGIGRFAGLEKLEVNGREQEAIRLVYKDNDILYISIHSLHRIARYTGKEGKAPVLNKLGSTAWASLKQRTKKKVKDIAKDLIALYARRKAQQGFAFSPDSYLQTELEASFLFEDTPDQLKATQDVKADMESTAPMDRLICGDVGFGKTEIAVRAAFKAVSDSKQVAILVPTTILAMQHYRTLSERLSGFPCTIDYLNRFKPAAEQKQTLQRLREGKIDILIGTHRLLSKDIAFRDLGLLVVDEEQKFGVAAKEKIKALKASVDTLTLTATPIPRTLQFSLMGARDLSIINTPPPNRYPVTTELHAFNDALIRDAILFEVSRGGQVFFIHNRVHDIHDIAAMLRRLCPDVRIEVGHGQMEGPALEKVMMSFIDGDADVLVSTTIVESGLDISNANTILINQAQGFGLSDLHQMRGRVGRSNKKAFCYLLTPPHSTLTAEARQRLRALEEFSDLGSGFSIAMRDLDIRGAGNLLGGEQSGFISEIGFEMYHKILDEAIRELKETEFKDLFAKEKERPDPFVTDCQIETDLEVLIPTAYVENTAERLHLYRELDDAASPETLKAFVDALADRFGPVPRQVHELCDTVRLRWDASRLGFEKLILKQGLLRALFVADAESPYYRSATFAGILDFVKQHPDRSSLREQKGRLSMTFRRIDSVHAAHALVAAVAEHLAGRRADAVAGGG